MRSTIQNTRTYFSERDAGEIYQARNITDQVTCWGIERPPCLNGMPDTNIPVCYWIGRAPADGTRGLQTLSTGGTTTVTSGTSST